MSRDSLRAIEEERRLFYVAITRAEENCVLSYAKSRFRNGQNQPCSPSRFLKDISPEYLTMPVDGGFGAVSKSVRSESSQPLFGREERPAFRSPMNQTPVAPRKLTKINTGVSSPSPSPKSSSATGLSVGAVVSHDRFGKGVIIAIEGDGGNEKATVSFENSGQKQLLLKYAKLQVVE